MARYVIHNKETGKFLKGTGKHKEWVESLAEADIYRKKLTSYTWDDSIMELVSVNIVIEGS